MSSLTIGKIEQWNEDRGFGFIAPSGGGEDVFLHISAVRDDARRPMVGDAVRYELGRDDRGRAQARGVTFIGAPGAGTARKYPLDARAGVVAVFLVALVAAWLAGGFAASVLLVYAVASAVAFGMYALDKKAARQNRWRIPEINMHLVALAGGWPGALLAQRAFRHKTRKQPFQMLFKATVVVNIAGLAWLTASPESDALLAELQRLIQ